MAKYWGSDRNRKREGKKNFFLTAWFWAPVAVLLVAGLIGLGWVWSFVQPFRAKAETFDLAKVGKLPSASFIYDRNDKVIGQIYIQNRYVIPISEMPEHLRQAVMAAEDARFFEHHGVDFYGITRAAVRNVLASEAQQGASTITQQLARNTFGMKERSIDRKITEMFLAWRLEKNMPKDEIMQNYLNLIFLGRGFYGVEAAARGYFGKHAKDLSIAESAALAGLIASPNNREPWNYYDGFKGNSERVIGRMKELGFISGKEYKAALADPLKVIERVPIKSQSYILDYVRQQVIDIVGWEGATSDGYHVYTTIDLDMQSEAQRSLEKNLSEVEKKLGYKHQKLAEYGKERDAIVNKARKEALSSGGEEVISPFKLVKTPEYLQGSIIALDNKTAGILAMVGGREFEHSEFNRAVYAKRPSGTAFLPIVYASAFEHGVFPGELVQDSVLDNRRVMIGGLEGILGEWGPESATNKYEGKIPARFALMKSKNAAGVRMGYKAGIDNVLKTAKRLGIKTELAKLPSTYLGASNTSLLEMALAYTNFPNGGWHEQKGHIINEIRDSEGKSIFNFKGFRQPGLDERVAYELHSTLSDALHRGTGKRAEEELGLKPVGGEPMDGGGKTGTAYDFTDLSFYGYSSEVTIGVWAGFDKSAPIFQGAFSNQIVLPVWVDIMNAANEKFPPRKIETPGGLEKITVCLRSGELADKDKCFEMRPGVKEGDPQRRWTCTYVEYTTADQKPKHVCRIHTGTGISIRDLAEQNEKVSGIPAAIVVPVGDQQPVQVMSKTIIGIDEDPYHSMKPLEVEKRGQPLYDGEKKADLIVPAKEILKATPVGPLDRIDSTQPQPNVERPAPLDLDNL